MKNSKYERLMAVTFVLALATTNAWAQNPAPDTWLRISAFVKAPLAGADVAVYDTAGNLLFQRQNATNSQGVYPALVPNLPSNFRVTVSRNGNPQSWLELSLGNFTLSADVQNFDPIHGIVYVNPVTTLVSRVLDKSQGRLNLQQVQALVRQVLGLPVNASLGAALREGQYFKSQYFSQQVFLAEAAKYGGVKPFLELLLNEILTQPEQTHLFAPAPALQSSSGGVLSFLATNLAKGALSWAAGQGCGWVAQSAGLTPQGATKEDIANLQAGLQDLQSSVDQLKQQLDQLGAQILAQLTQNQYTTVVTPALALAKTVDSVEDDLTYYALGCPPLTEGSTAQVDLSTADYCSSMKITITQELSDPTIRGSFGVLAGYVKDDPALGFKGLIHLYSQALGQTVRFFRPADSTKLQNMFDYWDSVQTQAANLYVELLHMNNAQENTGGRAQLTDFLGDPDATPPTQGIFQNTHNSEQQLMFPAVHPGTVINTKDRMMWATSFPNPRPPYDIWCSVGSPPYSQLAPYPALSNDEWAGLPGWSSPDLSTMQALIDGWTGSSPMTWLIDQAAQGPDDSPYSPSFPNIVNLCVAGGWIWTQTWTGHDSGNNQIYYIVDLATGTVNSKDGVAAPQCDVEHLNQCYVYNIPFRWQMIVRGLPRGEQYYWYP